MKRSAVRFAVPAMTAVLTLIVFLILFAVFRIFPLGSRSIVWCDMEQQAVPLLMQMREMLHRGEGISYTALDAGGMQFYGIFFFFLSNPFSLLILLTDTPADQLVGLLVILKLALASGTAALWLRSRVPDLAPEFQVLLGMMYGCSGYGLFYYQNLMWLDILVMVPLLMLALRKLLQGGSPVPYLLVLCTMMLLCFYLCFMVVLFTLIYTALTLRYTVPEKQHGRIALRFWTSSLLAAVLTAVVWLPCFLQVMHSARSGGLIERLMRAYLFNNFGDKLAVIGCTALPLAALAVLWMRGRSRTPALRRDRILCLLLLCAALIDPVNMMWHTGSYQAFPFRWAMFPILLLLTAAAQALSAHSRIPEAPAAQCKPAMLVLGGFLLLTAGYLAALWIFFRDALCSYTETLWLSTKNVLLILPLIWLLTTLYFAIMLFYHHREISRRTAFLLTAVLFASEFTLHFRCYVGAAANDDRLYTQTVSAADAFSDDGSLSRVRMTKKYAHVNMLGAIGFPTLAHYTSMTRADFLYGVKRLGYSSYWMEVSSIGGTLLSDALWNVRYQLGTFGDFPSWTEKIWSDDRLDAVENRILFPTAMLTDASPEEIADLPAGSRIAVQKQIAAQYCGRDDLITEYAPTALNGVSLTQTPEGGAVCTLDDPETEGEIRFSLFIPERQALYFDLYSQTGTELRTPLDGAVQVQVNGKTVCTEYPMQNDNGFAFLGEADASYVVVRLAVKKDFTCESFGLFGISADRTAEAVQQAEGAALQYQGGTYTCDVTAAQESTLILSAAYDEGLAAQIDGADTPVYRVNSCQAAVRLPAGTHHVTVRHHVQGLKTALLLTLTGIAAALILLLFRKHLPLHHAEWAARKLSDAAMGSILLLIYVMPTVLCILGSLKSIL